MEASDLTPAELRAIRDHKYYLSKARGVEVSIEEAIADFLKNYAANWRCQKTGEDNEEQIRAIRQYKQSLDSAVGQELPTREVAFDWCAKYAEIWRQERESLERNGFLRRIVTITNKNGLHMRPTSALCALAGQFDADVYLHKPGMEFYSFLLNGKPFVNLRSVLTVLRLGIAQGDQVEIIATGRQAAEALDAIEREISAGAGA